jgi:hypothetical protein
MPTAHRELIRLTKPNAVAVIGRTSGPLKRQAVTNIALARYFRSLEDELPALSVRECALPALLIRVALERGLAADDLLRKLYRLRPTQLLALVDRCERYHWSAWADSTPLTDRLVLSGFRLR